MRNVLASLTLLILTATGCASTTSSGEASCALIMVFRGHAYVARHTATPVKAIRRVGSAHFPSCFDHNHITPQERAADRAETRVRHAVWTLRGIDPRIAFAVPSEYPHMVFYSGPGNARLRDLPSALRRIITG